VTAETYLDAARNLAAAARTLNVHYNTVKARIARIEDLLGGALHNPQRRLELELAVRIWRLYGV
jgi:DNA-binding PucR family transcriptional regulator